MFNIPLEKVFIPYNTLFMLVNDSAVNQEYSPSFTSIANALKSYENTKKPLWLTSANLQQFKRNFHIFERTGIFQRTISKGQRDGPDGFYLATPDLLRSYSFSETIAHMTQNFEAFEHCYEIDDADEQKDAIRDVITSLRWGEYFDAFSMPMDVLLSLADEISIDANDLYVPSSGTIHFRDEPFPPFRDYQSNQIHAFSPSDNRIDPFETIIRREKANREHVRILTMLAALIRAHGFLAYENTFIDLYSETDTRQYIFEVKSNDDKNALSQIRKAIAQLYEYRYRSKKRDAILCIVLQKKPPQDWIEDYLLNDRGIMMCWLVDEVRLECPNACHHILTEIGIVE